jgi:hypothetical protein
MSVIYPEISDVCFFQRIPIDLVRMVFELTNFSLSEEVISDLQSIRAVNMARFRLRQKLNLTNTDREIFDFLSGL